MQTVISRDAWGREKKNQTRARNKREEEEEERGFVLVKSREERERERERRRRRRKEGKRFISRREYLLSLSLFVTPGERVHVFSLCANAFLLLDFLYILIHTNAKEKDCVCVRARVLSEREESGKTR